MLKTRVIPVLLVKDGLLKKPIKFKNPRTIANPIAIARVFEERQVDELILLDIGFSTGDESLAAELVRDIAEELSVPFAYGGGINSVDMMTDIVQAGAEKVVINTAAVITPTLICAGAKKFGSQCIVVSIDAMKVETGYRTFINSGSEPTGMDPIEWARQVEDLGAGELLINSIQYEGALKGYDIDLIRGISDAVSIPVIAAGGASCLDDFVMAVKDGGASAVAAGSIYHYTKHTPNMIKGALNSAGISVRMYHDVDYSHNW